MSEVSLRRAAGLRETAARLLQLANELEAEAGAPEAGSVSDRRHPSKRVWDELTAEIIHARVIEVYKARRRRRQFLPAELFGEPAWDMLLDLMAAKLQRRQISVSSACLAADVPQTTALRWLGLLEQHGLLERTENDADQRVIWVSLTDRGAKAMLELFEAIPEDSNRFGNLAKFEYPEYLIDN